MNLEAFLGFFNLLTFSSVEDNQNQKEQSARLWKNLVNQSVYDRRTLGAVPTTLLPFLFVDHVEQLDDEEQSMLLHGSIIMFWRDPRLRWNSSDYGGLETISVNRFEVGSHQLIWLPTLHFTELISRSANFLEFDTETHITLAAHGEVRIATAFSMRTSCMFEFSSFPYDVQNCSFTMYTTYDADKVVFSDVNELIDSKELLRPEERSPVDVGDFSISHVGSEALYILGPVAVKDPQRFPRKYLRSVVRFTITFRRQLAVYFATMALPLLTAALFTFIITNFSDEFFSLYGLMASFCLQIVNICNLAPQLPPDYTSTPIIARMASLLLCLTILLLLYKLASIYLRQQSRCTPSHLLVLDKVDKAVQVSCTVFSLIYIYVFIF